MRSAKKEALLQAISKYQYERIKGLLIEIELDEFVDLYETLREVTEESLATYQTAPLSDFDWDVGRCRYKPAYFVHVWSDDFILFDTGDFDKAYSEEELAEILRFMAYLTDRIKKLSDRTSFRIIPDEAYPGDDPIAQAS
ncbi:MAG: hypothetical protein HGB19_06035 [Chlorobiales bacterium]|nr:hypothetical protein [Chlorobiales bacterium]